MGRLNSTEFLKKVEEALARNDGKSSVYLTQKRLDSNVDPKPTDSMTDLSSNVIDHPKQYPTNTQQYPVLFRFVYGDKADKISTVVEPEKIDDFWTEYTVALKNGFVGLRKREKKKQKKSKVLKP